MPKKITLPPKPWMFPKPAALVGAMVGGKPNFMTSANVGIIRYDPAMLYVTCYKGNYTCAGVRREKAFSISVASSRLAAEVDFCGMVSGRSVDKSKVFKLLFGETGAPMAGDCPVCYDCRLAKTLTFGNEYVFIGEIAAIYADGRCVNKDGRLDMRKIDPLIYSTSDRTYFRLGAAIGPSYTLGQKLMPAAAGRPAPPVSSSPRRRSRA